MNLEQMLYNFIEYLKTRNFDWDKDQHKIYLINHFLESYKSEFISQDQAMDLFDPPPWNIMEYPEKTEGWIERQKYERKK